MSPDISIIIPALNEAQSIAQTLDSAAHPGVERIVVDGGSRDRTAEIARACGATVIPSPRGRARQMNAGANLSQGRMLLFLHADTRLPPGFPEEITRTLALPRVAAGAFSLRIDGRAGRLRWVERSANWRSRFLHLPYGDQGFFLNAELFRSLGGFPDLPLMEDLEMARRVRRQGRLVISPLAALTSSRRWERVGVLRATLLNQLFLLAYLLGMPPQRIAEWYYPNSKLQTLNPKS